MAWLSRKLEAPASESQRRVVLALCVITMSIMCIGLIWQSQIIANQRENIRWLQSVKTGG